MIKLFEGPAIYAKFERPDNLIIGLSSYEYIVYPNGRYLNIGPTDEELFWEATGNYLLYIDAAKV